MGIKDDIDQFERLSEHVRELGAHIGELRDSLRGVNSNKVFFTRAQLDEVLGYSVKIMGVAERAVDEYFRRLKSQMRGQD